MTRLNPFIHTHSFPLLLVLLLMVFSGQVMALSNVVKGVTSASGTLRFALKNDGTLWSVGTGYHGDGTTTQKTDWTQVLTGVKDVTGNLLEKNSGVGNGLNFALKIDGSLWATGSACTAGSTPTCSSYPAWTQVATNISKIDINTAIKDDGTVWMMDFGVLRDIPGMAGFVDAHAFNGFYRATPGAIAVKSDGTVWTYSSGTWTQDTGISNATRAISLHYQASLVPHDFIVLKSDGTVWGRNNTGYQFFDSSAVSPVWFQIDSNVVALTTSTTSTTAYVRHTDNSVWAAGESGSDYYFGDGSTGIYRSWIKVFDGASYISNGVLVSTAGHVWVAGNASTAGDLGLGDNVGPQSKWSLKLDTITVSKGTSTSVDLTWSTATGVTNYEVWRGIGANGTKAKIATITGSSYSDTTATAGKIYSYKIIGVEANAFTDSDIGFVKPTETPLTGSGPWSKVAQGSNYTLALQSNGTLWAAGQGAGGQSGDGSATTSTIYKQVLTSVRDVTTAKIGGVDDVSFAIKTDDSLWAAGGSFGSTWTQVTTNVKLVSDGYQTPTVIKNDGSLHYLNGTTLTTVTSITGVKSATQGALSSYAIKTDNTLWQASTLNGTWSQVLSGVKAIIPQYQYGSSYYESPIILTTGGDVLTKGLYDGSSGADTGLYKTTLAGVTALYGVGVGNTASGYAYALRNDGTLWFAGETPYGAAGNGTTTKITSWTQVLDNVASMPSGNLYANNYAGAVVRTNGTLWLTGYNSGSAAYALGLGDTTNRNVWTQYTIGELTASKGTINGSVDLTWTNMGSGSGTYEIWRSNGLNGSKSKIGNTTSTSYSDTTAAQGVTTGIVYGYHIKRADSSQISNIDYGYRMPATTTITVTDHYVTVKAGVNHSLALKNNGSLFAAGLNSSGQFGDGTTTQSTKFKQVLTHVADILAGNNVSFALKTDGTLWVAGSGYSNTWTQLLSGVSNLSTNGDKSKFWAVVSGTAYTGTSASNWAPMAYTGVKQLFVDSTSGTDVTVILKTEGSVLVDANLVGTGFKDIFPVGSSGYAVAGIKNDDSLWFYGSPKIDGTGVVSGTASLNSWVKVFDKVRDVATDSRVNDAVLVTKTDNTLWAASFTQPGIYGDGTSTPTAYWKQVADNVISVAAGSNHTLSVKTNGTLWVTGKNSSGEHGLNDITDRTVWTQTGFITPAKVTGVSATDGNQYGKVTVGWTADPDAIQYDVYRSTSAGIQGTVVASNLSSTGYEDTSVTGSTHYFYTIIAKNPVGSGPASSQDEGYGKVPAVISSLTVTQGTLIGKITLDWTPDPDANSYEVWRSTTAGGAATKIATLTAPSSGMDDTTISGVASYFYTIKATVGSLTGAASNQVEGWANGAPTAASASLTATSDNASAATAPAVTDPNVTAGKTETYSVAITTPPDAGTLAIVDNKFVYSPPEDGLFAGSLTFTFTATDKGGQTIVGNGTINVACGNPIISTLTLPSTSMQQATPFAANSTFSLPSCSTNGKIQVDVIDSDGAIVLAGTPIASSNGVGLNHTFTNKGLVATGSYSVRMTVSSDSGSATKAAALTVKAVNLPTLTVTPGLSVTVGEETVTAKLDNPPTVNCPFTSDVMVAMNDSSKCYIVFSTPPDGMTVNNTGALPELSGTIESTGNFPITAEVHKFNGTDLMKIGEITKTVAVSCDAPKIQALEIPTLLPHEVPHYGATYKAYACNGPLSGTLTISKGATVIETKNLSSLGYGTAAGLSEMGVILPEGSYTAKLDITGLSGAGSQSQSFNVKPTPMPTLMVSPATVDQSETRVDASLQPSSDAACPLTTDITLAQADPKRCYVELTSTVPDLTAGFDANGLPTLAGYPATIGDYSVIATVSRWVNGTRYDSAPLIKDVKVVPVVPVTFSFTGATDIYTGIEKLALEFKQATGSVCNLYADQATALAMSKRGYRACFVDATGDTGLTKSLLLNRIKFEGALTTIGTQTLSYSVKRVFEDGMVTNLHAGDLSITVHNVPAPMLVFKGGYKITEGKYYVPLGKPITLATVNTPVPTTAKMKISIADSKQAVEYTNFSNGKSFWVSTPELAFLEERPVTVRVAWQDYPSVYTEHVITAIGGTATNTDLFIETPQKVADTDTITVKAKVGAYTKEGINYIPAIMGQWRTRIYVQTNNQSTKTPVTEMTAMTNGEAEFQINPAGNLFMKLTAVSELVSNVDGLDVTLTSSTRFIEVVKGSPIEGKIKADTLDGPAPNSFSLELDMTKENRVAVKEVVWQESADGNTWTGIDKSNNLRRSLYMQQPGKRQVRVKMVNKNTLAESYTAPVEVWAYSLLDAMITGPSHMAPGYTVTLASELYRDGVLTTHAINEWTIDAPGGITTTSGATATITEEKEGKVIVTLKSRPADTRADDINAWTIARHYLTVKTPGNPSISAQGQSDVEIGKSYRYEGTVRPSWGSLVSLNTIKSEWVTTDGSTVSGTTLDWTPKAGDIVDTKPLIFRAWVEGFKETTTRETTVRIAPWHYIWPNFTVSMKQLTTQAPSDLLFSVDHDQPGMNRRFESLSYEWAFPANVTGRQSSTSPNRAAAQALYAGDYDVTVTVRDTRGHATVLFQRVTVDSSVPYAPTIKLYRSNIYERAPMTVTVRPTLYGGHPLDSIVSQAWFVDGVPVDEFTNRSYMVSDIAEAGSHVITYTINSKMGETATVSSSLSLIANQPPVCKLTTNPTSYSVAVEAKCTDPDGKVVGYEWQVDGQSIGATSYRISLSKKANIQTTAVSIKAVDDAHQYSSPVSISVVY